MKIKLKTPWSRAKVNKDGRIIGWDDFKPGDEVAVDMDTAEALIASGVAEKLTQTKQAKKSEDKQARPAENKAK